MTDLLSTVDPTTLAVVYSVVLGALSLGGYAVLGWLGDRTDRTDRKREREAAAPVRVVATYPARYRRTH